MNALTVGTGIDFLSPILIYRLHMYSTFNNKTVIPLVPVTYPPFTTSNASYSGTTTDTTTTPNTNYYVAIFNTGSDRSFSTNQRGVDLNIICVGGGGGGGGRTLVYFAGGGGGGSVIVTRRMTVDTSYNVEVGVGGIGGRGSNTTGYAGNAGGVTSISVFSIQADGGAGGTRSVEGINYGGKGHPFGVHSNNVPNGGNGGRNGLNNGFGNGVGGNSTMNMYSTTDRPTFYDQNGSAVTITTVVPSIFNSAVFTPTLTDNPFYTKYSGGGGGSISRGGRAGNKGTGGGIWYFYEHCRRERK